MNTDRLLTEIASGPRIVARRMIRLRAVELALINGRTAGEATKTEWERAKHELTGEAVVESVRCDPLPGSPGCNARLTRSANENDDRRNCAETFLAEDDEDRWTL